VFKSSWVRIAPHQPHRWAARNTDLFENSKAKAFVEGKVLGLLCLQVGGLDCCVAFGEHWLKQRSSLPVSLKTRIDTEKSEIPMRLRGMLILYSIEELETRDSVASRE